MVKKIITLVWVLITPFFAISGEKMIEDRIIGFKNEHGLPGIAVVVIQGPKQDLYTYGFANLDTKKEITWDTIFEIGSITKVFTSTALALAVEMKKVNLDDPVYKYLPYLANRSLNDFQKVTFKELATHTSGLPRVPPNKPVRYTKQEVLDYLAKVSLNTKAYLYSNVGYGIIGYALRNIFNDDLEGIYRKLICLPLNMDHTWINVPPSDESLYAQGYLENGNVSPRWPLSAWPAGGALRSTPRDLAQFLKANLGYNVQPLLSNAMAMTQSPIIKVNNQLSIGLGWQNFTTSQGIHIIDKNGGVSGFSSYIGFNKQKQTGVIVLTNKGKGDATEIGRAILIDLIR